MSFVQELQWRGMIHDIMPGTEEQFAKEMTAAYVGVDPTADSLHIGHLVSIMMLKHLQIAGHKPIALIGGATGMVGDPSGKSKERNMLSIEELRSNEDGLAKQMAKFLDFDCGENSALLLNNYDWFKDFDFLGFLRDVGKHISVSYMMSKDSVKKRLETGISFTEFSYQLLQGYDFYHLNKEHNCKLQMGGSDQWGNITTGTELVRRKGGGDAFALTCPLITKADGGKFGKTESGNVWLDPERTSPYQFYQFWLNCSDDDAAKYIKIFTLFTQAQIEQLEAEHAEAPHLRVVQKALAKDITIRVHSEEDYNTAVEASNILFGKSTKENLLKIPEQDFLSIFDGVPQFEVAKANLDAGVNILELVAFATQVFPSKGEARKMIKANGFSLNKEKLTDENAVITSADLLNNKYLLLQKGKKNYFLVKVG